MWERRFSVRGWSKAGWCKAGSRKAGWKSFPINYVKIFRQREINYSIRKKVIRTIFIDSQKVVRQLGKTLCLFISLSLLFGGIYRDQITDFNVINENRINVYKKCWRKILSIGEKAAALVNSVSAVRFFEAKRIRGAIKMQIIRAKIGQALSFCKLKSLNCSGSDLGNVNKSCENQVRAKN